MCDFLPLQCVYDPSHLKNVCICAPWWSQRFTSKSRAQCFLPQEEGNMSNALQLRAWRKCDGKDQPKPMSHLGILHPSVPHSIPALSPLPAFLIFFHLSRKHNTAETNSATTVKQSAVILNATMPDAGVASKWQDAMKTIPPASPSEIHPPASDSNVGVDSFSFQSEWIHLCVPPNRFTMQNQCKTSPYFFSLMGISDMIVWPAFHRGHAGKQSQPQDWYHLVVAFTF